MKVNSGLPLDQSNRYFYEINFIRAIASLSVVMVHVTAANYHLNDGYLNWLLLFLNQISRFGTPVFAVISGFLLYNQAINGRYHYKKFITSRFTKIVLPFIIWSIFYLILKSYSFADIKDLEGLKVFLYDVFLGKSYYHLYFIAVVIQFYLLFLIVNRFSSKKQLIFLTLIALYINFFYMMEPLDLGTGMFNKFLHERAFLFYWIFYFFFGGLLVHFWDHLLRFIKKNTIFIVLLGLVTILFMTFDYQTSDTILGSTRMTNLLNVPVLIVAFIGVYYVFGKFEKWREIVLQIGNMSMGIYLVHPLVIYFIRNDFSFLMERTRWVSLAYLITLLVSILIVKLIHKLPFGHYIVIIAPKRKSKVIAEQSKVS